MIDGMALRHRLMLALLRSTCWSADPIAHNIIVTMTAEMRKKSIFWPE